MVLMLPIASDNGARLAAILPTSLAALALGAHRDPVESVLEQWAPHSRAAETDAEVREIAESLEPVRSLILIVVDGLGWANLRAARDLCPHISGVVGARRVETVIPSTTGAALTTLATGVLPGEHGLIGYRIRHPELGLRNTLKEWDGISDVRSWQRAVPLWDVANALGRPAVAIGRPAHAVGGLTEAILSGAEYRGAQTIADRFSAATDFLRGGGGIAYLYVDELDRAAHAYGWESERWRSRLVTLDHAFADLMRRLPSDTGVVITADHGVIDVPPHRRMDLDVILEEAWGQVVAVGGEPRLRSLYLADPEQNHAFADAAQEQLGKLAWVGTREEAIAAHWFGETTRDVADRLGDVVIAARSQVAFTLTADSPEVRAMVGQHGSLSDEERGIPLIPAGALEGTAFVKAVTRLAALR